MKKYIKIIPLLIAVLSLASCLKDDMEIGGKPSNIIEFYTTDPISSPVTSLYPVYVKSFFARPGQNFDVTVSYSGTDVAPQDITLDIAVDPTAITKINAQGGKQYSVLPNSAFKLSTNKVTIKKGERRAVFNVTVSPELFDDNLSQAIPLKIASSSFGTISGNFGTTIYAVAARSKYDGIYTVTGSMIDRSIPSITGVYPHEYQLRTISSKVVALYDPDNSNYYHSISSDGAPSVYGNFAPVIYFDDSGKITKVENYYDDPAPRSRKAQLDPTGDNKITVGTAGTAGFVFKIKYFMLQGGAIRTEFNETFTLKGDRP